MNHNYHTKPHTILIVDDHPIVLQGIQALLASSFPDTTIFDADSMKEAEKILHKNAVDIMITDLDLHEESGLALIRNARHISPNTQVIIYTMHEEPWTISEIMDIDTEGVVMKSDNPSELLKAINSLSEEKGYYSHTFQRLLGAQEEQPKRLSEREIQIVELIAKGLSSADASTQLGITSNTVEYHKRRIMQKLKVANTAEMIKRATELGWEVNI